MRRSSLEKHGLRPLSCLGVLVPISGPSISRGILFKSGIISRANDTDFSLQIYLCTYFFGRFGVDDTWAGGGEQSAALKQHDMHCTNQATSTLGALMPHDRWVPRD